MGPDNVAADKNHRAFPAADLVEHDVQVHRLIAVVDEFQALPGDLHVRGRPPREIDDLVEIGRPGIIDLDNGLPGHNILEKSILKVKGYDLFKINSTTSFEAKSDISKS